VLASVEAWDVGISEKMLSVLYDINEDVLVVKTGSPSAMQ
jgi:hypothetical protein